MDRNDFLKFIKVTFLILHHFPVVFPQLCLPFLSPLGSPRRAFPLCLHGIGYPRSEPDASSSWRLKRARALAESLARGLRPQNVTFIVGKQEKSVFKNILKS